MINDQPEWDSFWNHAEELRRIFIRIAAVVLVGTIIAFSFHDILIQYLSEPLKKMNMPSFEGFLHSEVKIHRVFNQGNKPLIFKLAENSHLKYLSPQIKEIEQDQFLIPPSNYLDWEEDSPSLKLFILGPLDGLSLSLKISLWIGILLTSPLWLYFCFQFISPALNQRERFLTLPFFVLSFFFISLGIYFAYTVTIPLANKYLYAFNENLGQNLWGLNQYLDYSALLILSNIVAFEVCAILLLLVHYGILKPKLMQEKRKYVTLAAFILGALLTPPDILSQFLMALPMLAFYELSILYARLIEARHTKDAA